MWFTRSSKQAGGSWVSVFENWHALYCFTFPHWFGYHQLNAGTLFHCLPACPLSCTSSSKEEISRAAESIVTNLSCTHSTPCPIKQTNKNPEIFVSSLSSVLMAFCFPPAPQEDLVLELPQARAEEPPLRPLEVSSTVCVSHRCCFTSFCFIQL